jgi:hypothetical protein
MVGLIDVAVQAASNSVCVARSVGHMGRIVCVTHTRARARAQER